MRAAVDVEHIMHANEELGLAPRGPGAASRPQPPTRQLWDDEVGSVLDLFRAPDVHGHSWYGQWCFVGSLDSFCVNVVQDMHAVAGGAAMRLRYAAISNGVTGGSYVHGVPHWISVVFSVSGPRGEPLWIECGLRLTLRVSSVRDRHRVD